MVFLIFSPKKLILGKKSADDKNTYSRQRECLNVGSDQDPTLFDTEGISVCLFKIFSKKLILKKKKTQQTTKTHTVGKENGLMSGPDQNPNCLTLWCISDFFFRKI